MNREDTIKLFLGCEAKRKEAQAAALIEGQSEIEASEIAHDAAKQHWNAWAHKMLTMREMLEVDGKWAASHDNFGGLTPQNSETQSWIKAAAVDFSHCRFEAGHQAGPETLLEKPSAVPPVKTISIDGGVNMRGFVFPGIAMFHHSEFLGFASFDNATFLSNTSFVKANIAQIAEFNGTNFFADAWFNEAAFSAASFSKATFSTNTWFRDAQFSGRALFASAKFSGNAGFEAASFLGTAEFKRAEISGAASFEGAAFFGEASFSEVVFSGPVSFKNALMLQNLTNTFGLVGFQRAKFESTLNFTKFQGSGDVSFLGCTFCDLTTFKEAAFQQEADFTGIKVERAFDLSRVIFFKVPAFSGADFKQAPDLDAVKFPRPYFWLPGKTALIPRYRALRRMAIQGADYEREHMAFKGELRSRRWTTDRLWHPGLLLGFCYDGFADCGRSFIRPLVLWAFSAFGLALFYLRSAIEITPEAWRQCLSDGRDPWVKALYISGRNALVLTSGRDPRVDVAHKCLFGETKAGQANIPDLVSFVEFIGQVPLSAVLIFLILLAVKNRFKIK